MSTYTISLVKSTLPRIIAWSISLLPLSKNLTFWGASINLKYILALEEEKSEEIFLQKFWS
jgi:hypothetical protein